MGLILLPSYRVTSFDVRKFNDNEVGFLSWALSLSPFPSEVLSEVCFYLLISNRVTAVAHLFHGG